MCSCVRFIDDDNSAMMATDTAALAVTSIAVDCFSDDVYTIFINTCVCACACVFILLPIFAKKKFRQINFYLTNAHIDHWPLRRRRRYKKNNKLFDDRFVRFAKTLTNLSVSGS